MALNPANIIVNRILVVEDDRDEAAFLTAFLKEHKFSVEIARDAGQAHTAFTMHHPDCVLLDIMLPNNVSGFEVCDRMKSSSDSIPVIMLTAIDREDARDLALRVGADDYITKPYDPDELLLRIRAAAEKVWAKKHLGDLSKGNSGKVHFMCGECGKHMKVGAEHRGKTINCPKCGRSVIVPMHA